MGDTTKRERPILFSGPMVRAILAGAKTQTRRVVRGQDPLDDFATLPPLGMRCPYGAPGDRLWVRETWSKWADDATRSYIADRGDARSRLPAIYAADFAGWNGPPQDIGGEARWRPSIFMPRALSRIALDVTGVRVERLQDIGEEDARAEGIAVETLPDGARIAGGCGNGGIHESAREAYACLWNDINGKRAPWASNCWVWVVEFKRAEVRG